MPTTKTVVGRWESAKKKHWVELYLEDEHGYGYAGSGFGGYLGKVSEVDAWNRIGIVLSTFSVRMKRVA